MLKDIVSVRKVDQEKLHENLMGAGERQISGACKHCFQYLIPVYQLQVYLMIGQLWEFRDRSFLMGERGLVRFDK